MHISKPSPTEFINDFNKVLVNISDWFKINLVSLNFDKTYFVQFRTKSSHKININKNYRNKPITDTAPTFLD
jgi:hypothetical protein